MTLRFFEVSTGRELRSNPLKSGSVNDVIFSPDGRLALSLAREPAGGPSGANKLWEVATGRELRSFNVNWIFQYFSSDGGAGWSILQRRIWNYRVGHRPYPAKTGRRFRNLNRRPIPRRASGIVRLQGRHGQDLGGGHGAETIFHQRTFQIGYFRGLFPGHDGRGVEVAVGDGRRKSRRHHPRPSAPRPLQRPGRDRAGVGDEAEVGEGKASP